MIRYWLPAVLAFAPAAPAGAADEPPLNVLFLSAVVSAQPPGSETIFALRSFLPDERLQTVLKQAGIAWSASRFSTGLSWDYLKQFNVVVMLDFPIIEKHQAVKDQVRTGEALLARFVRDGGGLLATGISEYGMWGLERDTEELNRWLEPFDGAVLSEQVEEQDKGLVVPSFGASALAWTGNVVRHEVTAGVNGLLYPIDYAWAYYTHPVKVGPAWQVVLRASPSATTHTVTLGVTGPKGEKVNRQRGSLAAEPPLVAVRQVDAGRLALWPTVGSAYLVDAYHPFWGGGLIMEGNLPGKPSDGRALVINLLRWLGQPSRGKLGGVPVAPPPATIGDEVGFQTVDWDKVELKGRTQPRTYRGLIGLQSNLSVGREAPDQLLAAARTAGYDFAAFTEDLAGLTADKLARLKELCETASTDRFQAYPGFAYRDQSGNQWVTFGRQLTWPKPDWLVPDRPGTIVKNNFVFRGYQFPPVILTDSGHSPEPAWYQGNFKGLAVHTLRAGQVVDDATETYLGLQDRGFDLFPVVVSFAGSADEVRAAAAAPHQTYVRWWELPDVISALSGTSATHHGSYVFHRTSFVSGGPLLDDFRVYNFGSADLAIPHNDRYRIRVALSSPVGLREMTLADGPRLRRRVVLAGVKEWTGEFEGYQDRSRQLLVTATDLDGRRMLGSSGWTDIQEIHVVRCTDNLNTYTYGKHEAVKVHALRGLESYIDRQAESGTFFPFGWQPESERPAVDQRLTLVSRFGWIKDDLIDHHYPPTASANWNQNDQAELAQPQTLWRGRTRQTLFTPWADGTSVYLIDGDYELLRDLDLPQGRVPVFRSPWIADAATLLVQPTGGPAQCTVLDDRLVSRRSTLDGVDYVAQLAPPGGSRAIIPLQPGMLYEAILNKETRGAYLSAQVKVDGRLAKGEHLRYRYLAVWDTVRGRPDNTFVEEICTGFGLRGKPAYTVVAEHGAVADTRFTLRLKADGYGFAGTVSEARLPFHLPVLIEGLNERWPAGILYRGKHRLVIPVWRTSPVGDRYADRQTVAGENQLLRFGVEDGTGLAQIDTDQGEKRVYLGNLLVCERPEVFLELDDARPGKAVISVNNPLDEAVTITVRPGPGFDLLGDFAKTVTVPAGGLLKLAP